jgi:hypothetical protein
MLTSNPLDVVASFSDGPQLHRGIGAGDWHPAAFLRLPLREEPCDRGAPALSRSLTLHGRVDARAVPAVGKEIQSSGNESAMVPPHPSIRGSDIHP